MSENQMDTPSLNEQNPEILAAIATAEKNKASANEEVSASKVKPKAPEGTFIAVTTNAQLERNQTGKYGVNDRIQISFNVIIPNHDPESVEITSTYWKSDSATSAYYLRLSELLGKDPRNSFNLSELISITCQVKVTHNHTEKGVYANISEIKLVNLGSINTVKL